MTEVYFTHTVPIHPGQPGAWAAILLNQNEEIQYWDGQLPPEASTSRGALRCTFERCLDLGLEELHLHSNSRTLVEDLNQPSSTSLLPQGITLTLDLDSARMQCAVQHAYDCALKSSDGANTPRHKWLKFLATLSPMPPQGQPRQK